jgi:tight adherence protein B
MLTALICARASRGIRVVPRMPPRNRGRLRRRVHRNDDCAPMLTAIARQVRSGASLTAAAVEEFDQSTPFTDVLVRISQGASLIEALDELESSHPDVALTAQALSACAHLGGPVAATLDEAAAVLRERTAARAERLAHSSQTRLSARVLTIVPLGFALWSAIVSQRTRDVYLSSGAGTVCAACGLTLNLVGWRWMKRTIGR